MSIQLLKKHTLNPEITFLYQFNAQKSLFRVPQICNINFWIKNDPPANFGTAIIFKPSNASKSSASVSRLLSYFFGNSCCKKFILGPWPIETNIKKRVSQLSLLHLGLDPLIAMHCKDTINCPEKAMEKVILT